MTKHLLVLLDYTSLTCMFYIEIIIHIREV